MDALTDYTGYLLRTAFLRASAIAARRFEPGTHPRDAGVLITLLSVGPVSQQELVDAPQRQPDPDGQADRQPRAARAGRRACATPTTAAPTRCTRRRPGREALIEMLPTDGRGRGRAHGARSTPTRSSGSRRCCAR